METTTEIEVKTIKFPPVSGPKTKETNKQHQEEVDHFS